MRAAIGGAWLLMAGVCELSAQTPMTPATMWKETSSLHKTFYLRGLVDGFALGYGEVLQLYRLPEERQRFFKAPPADGPAFDSAAKILAADWADLTGAQFDPVIAIMDELYAAPANACIPMLGVAIAAIKTLHGKPASKIEDDLLSMRSSRSAKRC